MICSLVDLHCKTINRQTNWESSVRLFWYSFHSSIVHVMEYKTRQDRQTTEEKKWIRTKRCRRKQKDKNCESHLLPTVFIDFDFLLSLNYEQWQCQRTNEMERTHFVKKKKEKGNEMKISQCNWAIRRIITIYTTFRTFKYSQWDRF